MAAYFVGLISGTSLDAADAAIVDFTVPDAPQLISALALPPARELRERLLRASQGPDAISLREFGELDQLVAHWFSQAALQVLAQAGLRAQDVQAIGSHGQTLYHGAHATPPFTLQIGDPSTLARLTGLKTVGYFRQADIAAGGQGAPLAPAFHARVFRHAREYRCIVNLGGIANITCLPPSPSREQVTGFDTGPSNALMDAWILEHNDKPQDQNGAWAATGELLPGLLEQLLADAYLAQPAPKSTGREYFNLNWLAQKAGVTLRDARPVDVQRTLCEFTARTVAEAIGNNMSRCDRVLLCGGGAHNGFLKERLQACLNATAVELTDQHGIGCDWIEATTFAWLAKQRLDRLPGNLPSVTGAASEAILGGVFLPS